MSNVNGNQDEWYGFREKNYNYCVMVREHWLDSDERKKYSAGTDTLDGSRETFLRFYTTRAGVAMDMYEWCIEYCRRRYPYSENWYSVTLYRGNTNNTMIAECIVKGGKEEDGKYSDDTATLKEDRELWQ